MMFTVYNDNDSSRGGYHASPTIKPRSKRNPTEDEIASKCEATQRQFTVISSGKTQSFKTARIDT